MKERRGDVARMHRLFVVTKELAIRDLIESRCVRQRLAEEQIEILKELDKGMLAGGRLVNAYFERLRGVDRELGTLDMELKHLVQRVMRKSERARMCEILHDSICMEAARSLERQELAELVDGIAARKPQASDKQRGEE